MFEYETETVELLKIHLELVSIGKVFIKTISAIPVVLCGFGTNFPIESVCVYTKLREMSIS